MIEYIHIKPDLKLPNISQFAPFKGILILEKDTEETWQRLVSKWLIDMGCLYMMAWGIECSSWDDSVDMANLEAFNFQIPEEKFVITTWHENEKLNEVFWFSKHNAHHPCVELKSTIILHISDSNRTEDLLGRYKSA